LVPSFKIQHFGPLVTQLLSFFGPPPILMICCAHYYVALT